MAVLDGRTILQVIPDLSAGGAERTVIEVAQAIVLAGGRALVASRGGRLESALSEVGGELIRLDMGSKNPLTLWRNASRLSAIIRREQVDIIHARSRAPAWSALWAARRTGIAFVTTYHGAYNARTPLKKRYNSIMARGDVVIANSEWTARHIETEHPGAKGRVVTIPRGVELDRFSRTAVNPQRIEAVRAAFGLPRPDMRVILLPARLTRWKGQPEAITAFAMLPAELRAQCVLVFAGDAQGREEYQQGLLGQAETVGIRGQLRLLGHLDDMPAVLAAADIVITPSIEPEAFGRSAAEAAAMGLPVIAFDHGGARETVIDGETGLRVSPGDTAALSDALRRLLLLAPADMAAMGRRGRAYVETRFSTRALQESTLKVYQSLLGEHRREDAA